VPAKRNTAIGLDSHTTRHSHAQRKVAANAGGLSASVTTEALCFGVATLLAVFKKANGGFLLAVMAFSIPASALTSCRSDGGLWFAFLGILFKNFQLYVSWPGILVLPLLFLTLCITAPAQVLAWRTSNMAMVANVVTCAYLLYTHVASHGVAGSFRKGDTLVHTAALVTLVVTSILICPKLI